ncbi:hypothetical protein MTR67_006853 [Solanum verrucosum]|uniref:Integrase zinc-binding domain-containing protein n=1 Tax=Solanum verrucosum TaxID=315347 RepID=A0AAF0PYM5_SOLVR|nr:hypothetical protein MTR67_006853 [Solanum verrucosum]
MYHDLCEVFWWNGMKRDIVDFVAKYPYCQQVKVEHQKPRGQVPRQNSKPKPRCQGCPTLASYYPRGSRPSSRPVVLITVREEARDHALGILEFGKLRGATAQGTTGTTTGRGTLDGS